MGFENYNYHKKKKLYKSMNFITDYPKTKRDNRISVPKITNAI